MKKNIKIAILISGGGSNAIEIMKYFEHHEKIKVEKLLSNKINEAIKSRCKKFDVAFEMLDTNKVSNTSYLISKISNNEIDYVILAGYLKKIPKGFIRHFPNKIINLHPSLLPKYGGKGMYGANVHKAVLNANEKESGITIHFVNEEFDEGKIIAQFNFLIQRGENLETIQKKIQELEHKNFSEVIEKVLCDS